jgi:hypothetical protein
MRQQSTRKLLLETYVRAAWILKIRLLSARRHLWGDVKSLIHAETAQLQIRKSCESIGYMCVIAAEIEHEALLKNHRKDSKLGRLLKVLEREEKLNFPRLARLTKVAEGEPAKWQLTTEPVEEADKKRLEIIHEKSGNLLHEPALHKAGWPKNSDLARKKLDDQFVAIRGDHQWIWNRFWQHSIQLRNNLLFVSLGDASSNSQPWIIKQNGLLAEDLNLDFDPDYLADFNGPFDWPAQ